MLLCYYFSSVGHLPPARRVHQEGEGHEEAAVRSYQAHGHARRGQGEVPLLESDITFNVF